MLATTHSLLVIMGMQAQQKKGAWGRQTNIYFRYRNSMYISDSTGMHSACHAIFKRPVFRVLKVEFI